jgi:uncharacterized repeat protein (TIGR01451 family)
MAACGGGGSSNNGGGGGTTPPTQTTADVGLSMSVDNAQPAPGATVRFTLTAANKGPGTASAVVVNDLLSSSLTYVMATTTTGTYTAATGVWTVGDMPANTSQTLTLDATVNNYAGTYEIPNTAAIGQASAVVDTDFTNNFASTSLTVNGTGTQVNNVQPIYVNAGVTGSYANGVFTTVQVCVPGTSTCQTIDNVLVDTGSYGLRLLGTQANGDGLLKLPLPASTDGGGNAIAECTQFQDSYTWGPVVTADVQLAGEKATNVPIQILGKAGFAAAPSACTGTGLAENDTQATLGANGILGIGVFRHDCGTGCTSANTSSTIPPVYFSCPSSGCQAAHVNLEQEVQNPVWLFPQDNNGVLVTLPSIPAAGAISATGTLTFGLGTQINNIIANSATVLATDSTGGIQTVYQSTTYPTSSGGTTIFDSGSNGIFFLSQSDLHYPACPSGFSSFYCPAATANFTATNQSNGGGSVTTAPATWSVASADELFNNNPSYSAFNNLAGPNPGGFDFGLPFFFGKTIYFGINQTSRANLTGTPAGPFFAY